LTVLKRAQEWTAEAIDASLGLDTPVNFLDLVTMYKMASVNTPPPPLSLLNIHTPYLKSTRMKEEQ
jgi:hypothetical protein